MKYSEKKFNENPKDYLDSVSKLLNREKADANEIKEAVSTIENIFEKMKAEKFSDSIVKTHQIRRMYSLLRSVNTVKELYLIKPRLAYIGTSQKGETGKFIVTLLVDLIDKIEKAAENEKDEMIKGLIYIMESIVAYHKFHINK